MPSDLRNTRYVLTESDRNLVNALLKRFRPDPDLANSNHMFGGRPQLGFALSDVPDSVLGYVDLATGTPPDLATTGQIEPAYNLTGDAIQEGTLVERSLVQVGGNHIARMKPTASAGIAKWIWGTNLQELSFGDSGLIRVVGGAEEQGSQQTVHYLAINGLEIKAELQILAVYTLLDPADALFGYLLVDAGCDEPPPLRWGGILDDGGLPPGP